MPAYAGILQGVMTLMLATRLVLRAQLEAGPLGLDDVRCCAKGSKAMLTLEGSPHTVLSWSDDLYRPDHTWQREVWHGPAYMGRSSNDI